MAWLGQQPLLIARLPRSNPMWLSGLKAPTNDQSINILFYVCSQRGDIRQIQLTNYGQESRSTGYRRGKCCHLGYDGCFYCPREHQQAQWDSWIPAATIEIKKRGMYFRGNRRLGCRQPTFFTWRTELTKDIHPPSQPNLGQVSEAVLTNGDCWPKGFTNIQMTMCWKQELIWLYCQEPPCNIHKHCFISRKFTGLNLSLVRNASKRTHACVLFALLKWGHSPLSTVALLHHTFC